MRKILQEEFLKAQTSDEKKIAFPRLFRNAAFEIARRTPLFAFFPFTNFDFVVRFSHDSTCGIFGKSRGAIRKDPTQCGVAVCGEPAFLRGIELAGKIQRRNYYNKDTEKKGIAEIIIAKQRNGPIGTVELVWLPDYTKFANLQR